MKGIVFLQFTDLVDEKWGADMTQRLISQTELESHGDYNGVGTYCFREMIQLVTTLSRISGTPAEELQQIFGAYFFRKLSQKYPTFIEGYSDVFSFLETIENTVHVEVKKLYPEAELPSFDHNRVKPHILELLYRSRRPFADLAHGLIQGAINLFGEDVVIEREDFAVENGAKTLFILTKRVTYAE